MLVFKNRPAASGVFSFPFPTLARGVAEYGLKAHKAITLLTLSILLPTMGKAQWFNPPACPGRAGENSLPEMPNGLL